MKIGFYSIKIVSIALLFIIFGILGFICGILLDQNLFPQFELEKYKKKTKFEIWIDLALELAIFGILLYIIRNLVGKYILPNLYDNIWDFKWKDQRDVKSAYTFTLTMLYVQYNMKKKLDYLAGRL